MGIILWWNFFRKRGEPIRLELMPNIWDIRLLGMSFMRAEKPREPIESGARDFFCMQQALSLGRTSFTHLFHKTSRPCYYQFNGICPALVPFDSCCGYRRNFGKACKATSTFGIYCRR